MKSYKNWKLVNESLFPLGLSQPRTVGGLVGKAPLEESKKKMKGKMHDEDADDDHDEGGEEHSCSCDKNMKKKMKGEDGFKNSKQTPKDHSGEKSWSKEKKKKMGDGMDDAPMMKMKKKKPTDDVHDDDDDVEDDHIEDDDDVDGGDDDTGGDDDHHDDDHDEEGGDDDDHDHDEEGGDEMDMKKYGFMKKKMKAMKKKMKAMKEAAVQFEKDISEYPDMPQDHSQDSEKEFFASLARQFGKPNQKFSSGLSEDLLIPLNDPNAPAYEAPEPQPGDVGYAPQGRVGVIGSYAESTEFTTLCKYLGEEAARKLYKSRGK
jgi:hypothetical protein